MICFSSKREFSFFKFIINVQPLMFRQTTFIRSLKKVCKVLVLLQNWIASKSAQFFVVNSQTFFSKQQTPATEKMMVQYFAVCCQQSSFAVPPKSLHFERTRERERNGLLLQFLASFLALQQALLLHFQKFISYSRKL